MGTKTFVFLQTVSYLILSYPPTERPTWYFAGWRGSASTAGPSCAAPTSRAAPTPWHTSTVGVKRVDRPVTRGTALYTTDARHAWRSSFLYSATHTATPNSDETGVQRRGTCLFFFFFPAKWHHWLMNLFGTLCNKVSLTWLVPGEAEKTNRKKKKSLDVNATKNFLCGLLLLYDRRLWKIMEKSPEGAYVSAAEYPWLHISTRNWRVNM